MIRSITTLLYGVILAALVIAGALLASVWILGMAGKAALFGEPRATLAVKLFERMMKGQHNSTDITHISPDNSQDN